YRARATNNEGTATGADVTFTTLPLPTVTTGAATGISDLAATFNGAANANTGSYSVAYDYGLTTAYGSSVHATPSSPSGATSITPPASPPNLPPNTTYHYRLKWSDAAASFYGA